MTAEPFLRLDGVSKRYPGVVVLHEASLEAYRGEAMALMGANGAGKSTLMNVLGGLATKESGAIFIDGQPVSLRSPRDAAANGVAFVHQELSLLPTMTVAENVHADEFPVRGGLLAPEIMRRRTTELLARLGSKLPTDIRVENLSAGDRQIVEIARALRRRPRIIIFDEPTSSLTGRETTRLFEVIAGLKRDRAAIIYITHFIDEIFAICERVTVMRNGRTVASAATGSVTFRDVVHLMLGETDNIVRLGKTPAGDAADDGGDVVLQVKGLSRANVLKNVDLTLRTGEIVGLWGLLGSGRTELLRALIGLDAIDQGELCWRRNGELLSVTPRELRRFVGFVTEDRRGDGLFLPLSVETNIALPSLSALTNRLHLIARKKLARLVHGMMERLRIKASGPKQPVGTLSGGNQQKVVLARWLATNPRLLFLDEPTRGLDVSAKTEILKLAVEFALAGGTILIVSSALEDLMRVSDRYLVISRGAIVAQLPGAATADELKLAVSDDSSRSELSL
jgi:ABC-type sugar transport system ATPase subunit